MKPLIDPKSLPFLQAMMVEVIKREKKRKERKKERNTDILVKYEQQNIRIDRRNDNQK